MMTAAASASAQPSASSSHLTGKERDAETGLDWFEARYYSAPQGRFLSVDPESTGASKEDPQSWNAYAYTRNNPIKYTDPDGKRYKVCWQHGDCYEMTDPAYSSYLNNYILPVGYIGDHGRIYDRYAKGFVLLGTVEYMMSDQLWGIKTSSEKIGPFVDDLASILETGLIAAIGAGGLGACPRIS
jgi:RHS repeat-associated protein